MRKNPLFPVLFALGISGTALSAATPVDIRQGLVAYWPLEETADGITTADLSPFGNHLGLVNMDGSNFVPGRRGNAAQFNGTDELLSKIYEPGADIGLPVSPTRRFTVAFWVNGVGATQGGAGAGDRRVFSEGSTNSTTPLFNLGTDSAAAATRTNVLDVFIRNDGNTAVVSHRKTVGMPFDGTWHHIAYVQNDSTVRVYIDGVADATDFNFGAATLTLNTVSLGGIQRATAGSYYAGLIDDVAVWERPLSEAEVLEHRDNGLTTPIGEYPPLVIVDPVGATLNRGDNYQLTALAVGNRPVSYQWLKDNAEIPGAVSRTYTILNASAADAGEYALRVSNLEGAGTSAVATIVVLPDPAPDLANGLISYWPLDTVDEASATTPDLYSGNPFTRTFLSLLELVPGNAGLSNALHFEAAITQYAQRLGGFPAYNNTNHSLSFWVKGDGAAQFDVRVYAESSTNLNAANQLFTFGTVASPGGTGMRVFIRNDAGATLLAQNSVRPVFDGAWHHVVWTDSNGTARVYIDGLQDPANFRYTRGPLSLNTTTIGGILRAAAGNFFTGDIDEVAVWNRTLSFTEVNQIFAGRVPAPITILPPEITKQPRNVEVFEGADVILSVEALGTAVQYQWRKEGVDIPDATNSVLIYTAAVPGDSGVYTVRVSNSAGALVSDPATVTVIDITDATTGLVAYWPLDTVAGTTTPDTVNGNDLTLVNMDNSNLVVGRRGNALAFNGADELAVRDHTVTPSVGLPLIRHNALTVALWVNGVGNAQPTTPSNGDRRVFSEGSTTNNAPLFNLGTDNANASFSGDIYIRNDANAAQIEHLKTVAPVFDGAWHHFAYVENNGVGQFYVDGVLDGTSVNYTRTPLTPNTTSIGGIVRAAQSHWFLGQLDDVAVWRRALTASEINYVMNNGAVPPPLFRVGNIQVTETTITLTFTVPDPGSFYCVEQADSLTDPNWAAAPGATLIGPDGFTYQAQIPRTDGALRFYRINHCP
jgi:hypothetical protein